jgi:hypothetical protein
MSSCRSAIMPPIIHISEHSLWRSVFSEAAARTGYAGYFPDAPVAAPEPIAAPHHDSAREILELLELELAAMIRQLERAATSVASGAQSTASTLSAIRHRADALADRTSSAQATAETFRRLRTSSPSRPTASAHKYATPASSPMRPAQRRRKPASTSSGCANPPPPSAMWST